MAKTREEARQILLSSNLSADEKATLTAVMDAWPDETAIVAETLKPFATLAESLGEDGKLLSEPIAKGEPAALAAGVKTLLDRQKLLADDNKSMRDRLDGIEGEQKENAWRLFLSANRNKITPAEEPDYHEQWLKDRAWVEKTIPKRAPVVLTESVRTAGGAAGSNDRTVVINTARAEYREHPELKQFTGERAMVNDALRQKDLVVLSDEEVGKLAIAI